MQYQFTEECQLELLSEFDTEEAKLLRQMEEEVFDMECESEEYDMESDSEDSDSVEGTASPMIDRHNQTMRSPITYKNIDKKRPSGLPFSSMPTNNHFNVAARVG